MQSSRNNEIRKYTTGKVCSGEKAKSVATKAFIDWMCDSRIYSTITQKPGIEMGLIRKDM